MAGEKKVRGSACCRVMGPNFQYDFCFYNSLWNGVAEREFDSCGFACLGKVHSTRCLDQCSTSRLMYPLACALTKCEILQCKSMVYLNLGYFQSAKMAHEEVSSSVEY